jgi:hypothetical protein
LALSAEAAGRLGWRPLLACEGHRYSSVTCPNRRSRCLSLNLPISKSVVRLNATAPAWPNTFQSPCARCIAAAGLVQPMGSPAAMPPPSSKSKGNATKRVISAIHSHFLLRTPGGIALTGEKHRGSVIFLGVQVHSRDRLDLAKMVVNLTSETFAVAQTLFGRFHRIDKCDRALMDVIASGVFECSDVKARGAGGYPPTSLLPCTLDTVDETCPWFAPWCSGGSVTELSVTLRRRNGP